MCVESVCASEGTRAVGAVSIYPCLIPTISPGNHVSFLSKVLEVR